MFSLLCSPGWPIQCPNNETFSPSGHGFGPNFFCMLMTLGKVGFHNVKAKYEPTVDPMVLTIDLALWRPMRIHEFYQSFLLN
uniref:Uncharacterized protein n=1 Tax=Trichogramma kaykai TaxID=54128 RepID=A0ABD2W1T6_9HYME